ncbi:MAG TPA: hypothetical protein VLT84_09695 [Acidobacteriota bacterium]|nr:hypothetical protein [Acidobacteriota bacterium]
MNAAPKPRYAVALLVAASLLGVVLAAGCGKSKTGAAVAKAPVETRAIDFKIGAG